MLPHENSSERIHKGMKADQSLSQDRIDQLEQIGYLWQDIGYGEAFDKRCRDLKAFKEEFGHCSVPRNDPTNPTWRT